MGELIDWKSLSVYLADCHAANLELALKKSISKSERKRLFAIMKASKEMLLGELQPRGTYNKDVVLRDVVDRLSNYIDIIKQRYPEVEV